MTSHAPLNRIRFGHEHNPPINVRKTDRLVGIDSLAATIEAKGFKLIQPLGVKRAEDGFWYAAAGNRRLAAFQKLHKDKKIAADHAVAIHELSDEDINDLRESSLIENVERHALHPVDEFEAYSHLQEGGLSPEEIAKRFGVPLKEVRQALALGALAPEIREAWRKEEIDEEDAAAFTLATSHERQVEVFKKLKKTNGLVSYWIKKELGANGDAVALVEFVGRQEYEAAGGVIVEDLFSERSAMVVVNPEIAASLASKKRTEIAAKLVKDGWAWAEWRQDLPDGAWWNWRQEPKASGRKTPADIKAKTGVIIDLQSNGKVEYKYGVLKPGQAKEKSPKEKSASKNSADTAPAVSKALNTRLSEALTFAVQDAITESPRVALAALVAAIANYGDEGPVKIHINGYDPEGRLEPKKYEDFDKLFDRLNSMADDELLKAVGFAVRATISMRQSYDPTPANEDKGNAALLNAIDPAALDAALKKRFDAADYFDGCAAALVLKAVQESLGPDEANRVKSLKKAELAKYAAKNVPPTGWLPPELRTAHYKPPRELPEKPAKAPKKKAA